jgi:CHAT domain-containing protein/tetratricopeptide (TPR) repeat protein
MRWLINGFLAACFLCSPVRGDDEGVVLVRVAPGLAAESAGLRAGDRVLRWRQGEARGALASPFELAELEVERGPRGPVHVSALRGGESVEASLFPDDWGLESRPALPAETAGAWERARAVSREGEQGLAELRRLADGLQGDPDRAAWAWLEVARAEARRRRYDAAEAAVRKGLQAAPDAANASRDALLWAALGQMLEQGARTEPALAAYREARAIRERMDPDGVATAAATAQPALLARALGRSLTEVRQELQAAAARLESAAPRSLARANVLRAYGWTLESRVAGREAFTQSLALAEELTPDGLAVARGLFGLASAIDEPERQAQMRRRSVDIHERVMPDSTELVSAYSILGGTLRELGDLANGKAWNERALALVERLAPDTEWHAMTLYNTAIIHQSAGDLAQAETLLRRTLAIAERVLPPGERHALVQYAIGLLLMDRGEGADAERMLQKALGNLAPSGRSAPLRGYCLKSLGMLARNRGDLDAAERVLGEALDVFRTVALPMEIGNVYRELGRLQADRGKLDEAAAAYEQGFTALASHRWIPAVAALHGSAGDLALLRGDLDSAERHQRASLELAAEIAPGSLMEALAAHGLGTIARRRGRPADALAFYERAVAAFESQSAHLGGSAEARAGYRAQFHRFYLDLEEVLLELGRDEAAFEVLERSRARELLRLLAGRDLELGGLPEGLTQERRRADAEHDRILKRLSGSLDDAARSDLVRQLADARRRRAEVRARIRDAAPRAAALRDPEALGLAGVRQVIDPGTLLLSYRLGPEKSRVYAVGPGPDEFAVLPVELGEKAIQDEVERFRDRIERRKGTLLRRDLDEQSARLGRILLGPAASRLARAQRLLVVPDRVLHLVPFAALRDPSASGRSRYVVETLPLHVVSSVTLYAQITRPRQDGAGAAGVVGFGDPSYPRSADLPSRAALTRALGAGLRLSPIPASRRELAALKRHFPRSADIFVGAEATEERARSVARSTRVVHFATHGFVDEAFPLESGLVLAIPPDGEDGKENGLLQAWEIFERVRLDAELVTLSACQTALGKEVAGEGLLGLTWAFQYAGARSVLASLWEVNDASTADLMRRFYGHLQAGQPKAEALRRAQIELLRRPATSAPFLWAAFHLTGDWR